MDQQAPLLRLRPHLLLLQARIGRGKDVKLFHARNKTDHHQPPCLVSKEVSGVVLINRPLLDNGRSSELCLERVGPQRD
jgi:hypothetical protein